MKRNVRLKMSVVAMAMLFMPLALSAQTDGFFTSDNNGGGNRGVAGTYPVNSGSGESPFEFEAPIGNGGVAPKTPISSGLLIMVAAGAGYLALKKKEEK
ncbi:MAG: hypothetical protein ACI358_07725 [Candidatus Limimorpha sp.]